MDTATAFEQRGPDEMITELALHIIEHVVGVPAVFYGGWILSAAYYGQGAREPSVGSSSAGALHDCDHGLLRAATHEAGHAIAALRCSVVDRVRRASLSGGGSGAVEYTIYHSRLVDSAWCDLVITLSGVAAEIMCHGSLRSAPAGTDLLKALGLARALALGDRPSWAVPKVRAINFTPMFTEDTAVSAAEEATLRYGYCVARDLLEAHRAEHTRLAEMLLARRVLEEQELNTWFGGRRLLRMLGLFRACFVQGKS